MSRQDPYAEFRKPLANPGNIDLAKQPIVKNADGTTSTVRDPYSEFRKTPAVVSPSTSSVSQSQTENFPTAAEKLGSPPGTATLPTGLEKLSQAPAEMWRRSLNGIIPEGAIEALIRNAPRSLTGSPFIKKKALTPGPSRAVSEAVSAATSPAGIATVAAMTLASPVIVSAAAIALGAYQLKGAVELQDDVSELQQQLAEAKSSGNKDQVDEINDQIQYLRTHQAIAALGGTGALYGGARGPVRKTTGALGRRIETAAVKPLKGQLEDVYVKPGENPTDVLINNIYKHELGGSLQKSFEMSDSLLDTYTGQLTEALSTLSDRGARVDLNKALDATEAYFKSKPVAARQANAMPEIMKAIQRQRDAIVIMNEVRAAENGVVDLGHATTFKRGVSDEGAWLNGHTSPEEGARALVANQLYKHLRLSIEVAAEKSGPVVRDLNKRIGEILPIREALVRRLPVAKRNEIIGLKEFIGASLGDTKGLGLSLLNRTLRSPVVANWLVRASGTAEKMSGIELPPRFDPTNRDPITGEILMPSGDQPLIPGTTRRNPRFESPSGRAADLTTPRDPITGEILMPPSQLPSVSIGKAKAVLPVRGVEGFSVKLSAQERAALGQKEGLAASVKGPAEQTTLGVGPYRRSGAQAETIKAESPVVMELKSVLLDKLIQERSGLAKDPIIGERQAMSIWRNLTRRTFKTTEQATTYLQSQIKRVQDRLGRK